MAIIAPAAGLIKSGDTSPLSSTLADSSGLIDSNVQTAVTDSYPSVSVGVDLGEPKTVTSITVRLCTTLNEFDTYWYDAQHSIFEIYTSDDNLNWTLQTYFGHGYANNVDLVKDGTHHGHVTLNLNTTITARYLKIRPGVDSWSQLTGSENFHVAEVEAHDTAGTDRFWVGNGGSNDSSHWSLTSGGINGASVPSSVNDVYFDANSFSLDDQIVSALPNCRSINFTGITHDITIRNFGSTIYGNITLVPGITFGYSDGSGQPKIYISGKCDLTSAGHYFEQIEAMTTEIISLQDNLDVMSLFHPSAGRLNLQTNGHSITIWNFYAFDSDINLDNSVITIRNDDDYGDGYFGLLGNNTLSAVGSTIKIGDDVNVDFSESAVSGQNYITGGAAEKCRITKYGGVAVTFHDTTFTNCMIGGGATFSSITANGCVDGGGNVSWIEGSYVRPMSMALQTFPPAIYCLSSIPSINLILQYYPFSLIERVPILAAYLGLQSFRPKTNINNRVKFTDRLNIIFKDRDSIKWNKEITSRSVIIPAGELILTGYGPTTIGGVIHSYIPAALLLLTSHAPQTGVSRVPVPAASLLLTSHAPNQIQIIPALIPAGNFILQSYSPSVIERVPIPPALLILTPYAPDVILNIYALVPPGNIILTPLDPQIKIIQQIGIPAASLILQKYNPRYTWTPANYHFFTLQNIYLCILTGDADGLDDLIIPISSFQSTMRDGDPSYLACVIPNSVDWIASIADRTNGDILIRKGYRFSDGTIQAEEICRVTYESLQIFRGARSDSAMISGHLTTASSDPKSVTLSKVSYYGLQADGKRTFRAEPDLFLRVGDTAVYGSESFVVGQISYIVDSRLAIMQVTEA